MPERRKYPRIPLISIARLTPQGMETVRSVLVRDISTHGVGIYSEEPYEKGELVVIHLALAAGQEETITESIAGEVAWVAPLPDGTHYSVGIRFDKMEIEKPRLYEHIKQLEGMGGGQY
ncbi:MAG: PilZ domain-containing protein [Candidatus Manganitrophaceae bacterium]|nr:MAG: PilZ domain-containing protein [Candidatus Manganitrophaceae bacterium]